jgi:iron(III) transport system ATP-binding protein
MSVEIANLKMGYGSHPVVDDLCATFQANAISVLLGPSGCGKTTILRCIAGLEQPSEGTIRIADRVVFSHSGRINLPPDRRELGMVFQSNAIWPHMTVFQNVALPLRARRTDPDELRARVDETLAMVGLAAMRDRRATQLSGGQQQRVAIARCIVARPKLMLLDEPLSNLDARLRVDMRRELKELQQRTGLTMLFVTHDQEEAMSLADEIFLFQDGRIVQQGTPQELYRRPRIRYVAELLGKANLFPVVANSAGSGRELRTADRRYLVTRSAVARETEGDGPFLCVVRPEAWSIVGDAEAGLPGRIESLMFLGDRTELTVDTPAGTMVVLRAGHEARAVGERIHLGVDPDQVHLLPPEAG